MNTLKTIGRNAVLFAIGGTIYYMIELIWRGYSSLPMVLVGGLCFLFCGSINEFLGWDMLIWKQMFICAVGITAIEFLSGYILKNCASHSRYFSDELDALFSWMGNKCL